MTDDRTLEQRVEYLERLVDSLIKSYSDRINVLYHKLGMCSENTTASIFADTVYQDAEQTQKE